MSTAGAPTLWRVFPWDQDAAEGTPFSPTFVPDPTGRGRFDLPSRLSAALYLAESPEHAVAELLHPWRGRTIDERNLVRAGWPLAIVEVEWAEASESVADLCDPAVLSRISEAPDRVASRHRAITQSIARKVWDAGADGLRWWSRFWGDWHTVVAFADRALAQTPGAPGLRYGVPEALKLDSPSVATAARLLGIALP